MRGKGWRGQEDRRVAWGWPPTKTDVAKHKQGGACGDNWGLEVFLKGDGEQGR